MGHWIQEDLLGKMNGLGVFFFFFPFTILTVFLRFFPFELPHNLSIRVVLTPPWLLQLVSHRNQRRERPVKSSGSSPNQGVEQWDLGKTKLSFEKRKDKQYNPPPHPTLPHRRPAATRAAQSNSPICLPFASNTVLGSTLIESSQEFLSMAPGKPDAKVLSLESERKFCCLSNKIGW